ncbi:protein trapped in endoderm-1-like [Anneissia japonica]|uniref:protein trapped in endoderm-1-like n=1 Tax=Anneissia japonica TaxID=1529436 RepID=UPI001425B5CF|nr:protein trapped in endoderm-1-like [Anneissia japonica]
MTEYCYPVIENVTDTIRHASEPFGTVIEIIYLITLSIVGSFGNIFVIFAIIVTPALRTVTYFWVANLALFDLITTGFLMPFFIYSVFNNGWNLSCELCYFLAYITLCSIGMSMTTLTSISINRYILITKSHQFYIRFTQYKYIILGVILNCTLTIVPVLMPFYGLGEVGYNVALRHCGVIYGELDSWKFEVILLGSGLTYSVCLLTVTNYLIYKAYHESRRRVHSHTLTPGNSKSSPRRQLSQTVHHSEFRVMKTVIIIVSIACFCWIPYSIALFSNKENTTSIIFIRSANVLIWTNATINPFLYALTSTNFKKAAHRFFCCQLNLMRRSRATTMNTRHHTQ